MSANCASKLSKDFHDMRRPMCKPAKCWRNFYVSIFILALALPLGDSFAQDEHSKHHQDPSSSTGQPPSNARGSTNGQKMEVLPSEAGDSMMRGTPTKEFYPFLMQLPSLSPEQRQIIEGQARAQVYSGIEEVAKAEQAIRHAIAAKDALAADQSAQFLRQSIDQVTSGTATLRALDEGQSPQQIAQKWFKTQLGLLSMAPVEATSGPLGLSWYHWSTMFLLTAFSAGMLSIHFFRMRRANSLLERLTNATITLPVSTTPVVDPSASRRNVAPSFEPFATSAYRPTSDAVATASNAIWKGKLQVAAIFSETQNVKTFRLRNAEGGRIPFNFLPGQFLTYSAEIDGKVIRRSYTIASSPSQSAFVETTIKREDFGVFSDYLHDRIKVGDLLDVTGPSGVFTFQGSEASSIVLIGGGVGITPLMAAIRYLTDTAWSGDIYLVYGARTSADFIFRDELEYLQRHHANLHVAATMARAAGTSWVGPEGSITKEFLLQVVPDIVKRRIHLCGPPGMMTAMRKILAELGMPDEQIKSEGFGRAQGAVPPPSFIASVPTDTGTTVGNPIAPEVAGPATASLRFARSNKTVPLPPDRTVLEVAEANGVSIDYACRAGICGTCKITLLEGAVTMDIEEALTPEDKASKVILACQAKSIANLVVEA